MAATPATNDARLDVRLPSDTKVLVEQAASCLGQSVSDFVKGAVVRSAQDVIQAHTVTALTNRDRDVFLAMLDSDAPPNRALQAAAKRYRKDVG